MQVEEQFPNGTCDEDEDVEWQDKIWEVCLIVMIHVRCGGREVKPLDPGWRGYSFSVISPSSWGSLGPVAENNRAEHRLSTVQIWVTTPFGTWDVLLIKVKCRRKNKCVCACMRVCTQVHMWWVGCICLTQCIFGACVFCNCKHC